jgi:hypothetical protein
MKNNAIYDRMHGIKFKIAGTSQIKGPTFVLPKI